MKIRSIGIDTITFVIASRPGFIDAKSANGRFISQLAASALHYRVSTNEDGVQRRPAYGQTAISGSYRGLYVVSNEQMTTVTCSVPSLIGGNNINGFPINRMNEFVEEVSSRIEEDVSVGRITRLDLCVNVDSSAMLVDFMDQYYSTDRRYKESLYERSTKYIGCKSKQNALYSQVNRYSEESDPRGYVDEYLSRELEVRDMIRWELRLRKPVLNRNRITLAELISGTEHDWLWAQYTGLLGAVGVRKIASPIASPELGRDMWDGLKEFKSSCIELGINAYGKERMMNLLLANKNAVDRKVFRAIKELVERTSVPNAAGTIESPANVLKEIVANGINEFFDETGANLGLMVIPLEPTVG